MTIVITSKHNGFRRCGVAHPSKPTRYADDFFTEAQLRALDKEPQLLLAYEEDGFDQVGDENNDNASQSAVPQAPNTSADSQSQANETVVAPVAAPVVSLPAVTLEGDQSGPVAQGAPVDPVAAADKPVELHQDESAQTPADQPATPVEQPAKGKGRASKGGSK
ncbi:HI1506-related protein [Pseudomonas asplenii]|nr:HI1506-related protein [Pseudomonas fuscovaginae]